LYKIAASPRILSLLTPLLGENIVLWGCSFVRRRPREAHPWHVDIETAGDGRFASVWIGLENARRGSGLQLISGSHRLGKTVQQVQAEHGMRRGDPSAEMALEWARESDPGARLMEPELGDGDAIIFDGGLWHASRNDHLRHTRYAFLLQFAAADSAIRIPDPDHLEWPFRFLVAPRAPVVPVQGSVAGDANRLMPPPIAPVEERSPMLSSCIRPLDMPLAEHPDGGWQPHHLFKGSTRIIDKMSCHAAVLSAGHSPHPPHAHKDEELLVVLDGEAELLIADEPSYEGARVERVKAGAFAYYPAYQHHTIRNPTNSPVTYLMFKWHATAAETGGNPLGTQIFHRGPDTDAEGGKGFVTKGLFGQPTGWLRRLHCHITRLDVGAGYAPHVDAHDVAILVQSGRVKTLGEEVGPNSIIYYPAGERHGMENVGDEPARYLVFEFHAPGVRIHERMRRRARRLAGRVLRRTARAFGAASLQKDTKRAASL
jgi:mannose-6-phosphate isomerase-like protein (cupin superfamily)